MDIGLAWNNQNVSGDILIEDADIVIDEGLTTSVIISLFTNARVPDKSPTAIETGTPGGFWGDSLRPPEDGKTGSKKWSLFRGKTTAETIPLAKLYDKESLEWMSPNFATNVEVEFERRSLDRIDEVVRIYGIETETSLEYWEKHFASSA